MPPRLSVVIPVYNEAGLLDTTLRRVVAVPIDKEVIVVDDGSTDSTGERLARLARELPIRVVTHSRNTGKGAAVRSGFQAATGDILLIQDADLEYDPTDYPAVIAPILRGEADAVMGSRFLRQKPKFFTPHGDPFFTHYLGNRIIIWMTNLLYGFRATDYEGCYKAFTRTVVRDTPVVANGFEFDNELICKLLRRGRRIVEVPIRYSPRAYAEGKKIRWQHGLRIVWTILKWRVLPLG